MTTDSDVLNYIRVFQSAEGYAPSIREIAKGVGLASGSAVLVHLKRLEKQGRIQRGAKGNARAIRLVTQ